MDGVRTNLGMRRKARIRQASLEDYDRISSLQLRNGLAAQPREDWEALRKTKPVCPQEAECPIGWVLETAEAEIVGSVSSIPLAYRFRGRDLRVASVGDWAVDPPYRGYSMFLLSQAQTQRNVDLLISTTVNPISEAILRVLKWTPVPVGNWNRAAFLITAHHGFLKAVLALKSIPFSRFVSYPCAAALFSVDRLRNLGTSFKGVRHDIELCSGFDERFDAFWLELENGNPDALLAVRSQESLAWHFRSRLLRGNIWILAVHKGCCMVGYAIFDRRDKPLLGLKRVRLVDFWALESPEEVFWSALEWMKDRCRREGIHMVELIGWLGRPEIRRIRALHHRRLPSCLYYYKAQNAELGTALLDANAWRPSLFDGDASL